MDQKQKNALIVTAGIVICLCLAFVAFYMLMFSDGEPQTAADFAEEYGGNLDVYAQILSSNDCAYLQEMFDNAYTTNQESAPGTVHHKRSTGFMTAANKRMEDIGCYK